MTTKEGVRKRVREALSSLPPHVRSSLDERIQRRVIELLRSHPEWRSVGLYASRKEEPSTVSIFEDLRRRGVSVSFPRVEREELRFYEISNLSDLVVGSFGILEPPSHAPQVERLDAILLPGVAFDESGGRVGRGKGFYDRFLQKNSSTFRIGVAFEVQILPHVPMGENDARLDALVTEKRTRILSGGKR